MSIIMLTQKAEREETEKSVKQAGQYGNFKMAKNDQDNRYFLILKQKSNISNRLVMINPKKNNQKIEVAASRMIDAAIFMCN